MRHIFISIVLVVGIHSPNWAGEGEVVRGSEQALWNELDLERPELSELKAAVAVEDRAAAAIAWAKYFAARTSPTCHFERDRWPAYIRQDFPAVADAILRNLRLHLVEAEAAGQPPLEFLKSLYGYLSEQRLAQIVSDLDGGPVIQVQDIMGYVQWQLTQTKAA